MIPNFYIIEKDQEQTVGFDVDVTFDMEGVKNYITTEITNVEFINGRVLNNHTTYAKVTINLYDAEWLSEEGALASTVRFFNKLIKTCSINFSSMNIFRFSGSIKTLILISFSSNSGLKSNTIP